MKKIKNKALIYNHVWNLFSPTIKTGMLTKQNQPVKSGLIKIGWG
ncbi:hypothetical protein SAMN05444412_104335 [Rhodonellum ikkaensis]|uniref:Uncharacterized protein n=2 Tax=Rhodonellum TaxID=336827 RepID=A0A1H3PLW5_9BACT|nr:hypothetical protein SAMN05444412_104335 [Rhodonellum ikkaensis]